MKPLAPTLRHYGSEIAGATIGGILVTSLETYVRPSLPEPHAEWWYVGFVFGGLVAGGALFSLGKFCWRVLWDRLGAKSRNIRELEIKVADYEGRLLTAEAKCVEQIKVALDMCKARHNAAHQMRDALTRLFPLRGRYEPPPLATGSSPNARPPSHPALLAMRSDIGKQLNFLVKEFEFKLGGKADVFACLRELCGDDKFHTFDRAGTYDVNRDRNTAPWDKTSHTVYQRLFAKCKDSHCAILSLAGTREFPDNEADRRRDSAGFRANECMLTGAVFAKSMVGNNIVNSRMVWIVSVCVNRPGIFNESDCEILRTHVDLFSALLNGMLHAHDLTAPTQHQA